MGAILSWVSDKLLLLHGPAALAVVFLLPALEASIFLGFLLPGEIAVVIGGYLAFNHTVNFFAVLAAAILGAIIGDSVGYSVGKRWGDVLLRRLPKRFVKPEHIEQGKELINRLGGKAVFTGRFAAALRALVPGLCGVSRLPYRKFLFWNVLGGALWATGFTLLGYAAGNAWHKVEHAASLVSWVMLGVVVLATAVIVVLKKRRARSAERVTATADSTTTATTDPTGLANGTTGLANGLANGTTSPTDLANETKNQNNAANGTANRTRPATSTDTKPQPTVESELGTGAGAGAGAGATAEAVPSP